MSRKYHVNLFHAVGVEKTKLEFTKNMSGREEYG
jgi:hypothetical protein